MPPNTQYIYIVFPLTIHVKDLKHSSVKAKLNPLCCLPVSTTVSSNLSDHFILTIHNEESKLERYVDRNTSQF